MNETKEFKCPNCGGRLEFDSRSQKLKCPFCEGTFDPESFSTVPEFAMEKESWQDDDLLVYACNSCGAEIICEKNTVASLCPYCGSSIVFTGNVSGALKPARLIPFRYDKKEAKEKYKEHLKGKFLLPKAFTSEAVIDEIKGIYVPYWLFDGKAQAGLWFDAVKKKTWVKDGQEYTETSHYKVFRSGHVCFKDVPVDASARFDDLLSQSIEPFDGKDLKDFSINYLAGHYADSYDVDAGSSRKIANERITNSALRLFNSTLSEYDSYELSSKRVAIGDGHQEYVLFPIWLLNVDYQGKRYPFAMNGQTGKFVGDLPSDKSKLVYFRIALFIIIFVLVLLIQLFVTGVL